MLNRLGFGSMLYALPIPLGFKGYTIVHLEILNIVVAAKKLHWAENKIQIYCDNMAVVDILNTGKARDITLATCARNLWLIAAMFNIDFIFSHIPGVQNSVADLLSRWKQDFDHLKNCPVLLKHQYG